MNLLLIAGIILVVLVIAAAVLKAKSGASEGTAKPDAYDLKKSPRALGEWHSANDRADGVRGVFERVAIVEGQIGVLP